MLPPEFAAGPPRRFTLAEQFDELKERYACLGPSDTLDWVFEHVQRQGATEALLEHEYVDRDYRDEYANFYYHHVLNDTPARTMSDIVGAASEAETERVVPSRGLTEEQVGSTRVDPGMPPSGV